MSHAVPLSTAERRPGFLARSLAVLPHLDLARTIYGIKVALAVLIAVGIEFWFDLGMADSAAICVLVVNSNLLGTTIYKSVLRMLGNLIGCTLGLGLIALFAQDRVAGTLVYSLYSAICCYFLQRSRYAPAWHWVYDSAAIVFIFHLGSPTDSFTFTAERWLELSIGILSMTFVSSVLWPSRAGTVFEHHLVTLLQQSSEAVRALSRVQSLPTARHGEANANMLAAAIPALRTQLDTASHDTSRYEKSEAGYQRLIDELQSLIARTVRLGDSVSGWFATAHRAGKTEPAHFELITDACRQLSVAMDELTHFTQRHFDSPQEAQSPPNTDALQRTLRSLRDTVANASGSLRDSATSLYVCEMLSCLEQRMQSFTQALLDAERGDRSTAKQLTIPASDTHQPPFWKRTDVHKALVSGLTVGVTFVFWMLTNWPAGSFAVFFAVLITSKNCTAPYLPPMALIPGAIVGILVGSLLYLGVLPALDGFWELAVVLFAFCAVGGYLMLSANAKIAGVAGLTTIVAVKLLDLQSHQTVSFSHIVGFSYGVLGGTFLAFILLSVLWPVVPEKNFTSQIKAIFGSCRQWLAAMPNGEIRSPERRTAFAQKSAKQLSLCLLWGKFLNYKRLPEDSRSTVSGLQAAIQSLLLHLIELDRMRPSRDLSGQSVKLVELADRLDRELCRALDTLTASLEDGPPVPLLADTQELLQVLEQSGNQLVDEMGEDRARGDAAVQTLVVIGQYHALVKSLQECHQRLHALDWRILNQSYF